MTLASAPGFKPGDFVRVEVVEPPVNGVVRLPASALGSDGEVLLIGEGDRLEALPVELVRRQGDDVLVRAAGLDGRDVVKARTPLLGAGIKVNPLRGAEASEIRDVETILSYFTRHRTLANITLIVMIVAGLMAMPNMRAQFFPDVIVDNVSVSVTWDGAGAEDVDAAIVQVIEPALLAVDGVDSSSSTSREGRASLTLEFEPGWDMARAAEDVQTAVDQVTGLPEDAEEPTVRRGQWRDRVTDVVITGPVAVEQLALFADEFVQRLFAEGVTRTTIRGIAPGQTVIEVPSANLIAYDIAMSDIATAIAAEVDADPAGDVSGGTARVRTGVEKRTASAISGIVLRSNPDGSNLTVGDVATVTAQSVDRDMGFFVGDDPAITIRVDRSDKGDAIGIQSQVEEVAAKMQETLPQGVTLELIRTRAEAISGRLNLLLDNALTGLALVVSLLFLFLNARTAFWVAAGIPAALMGAIALMYLGGLTINMISLFALIITLGIVVDDAIVVGEHADFRARRLGEPPVLAAENAARRMALPVFSATLTTVIAFFGLTVISGRFGDLIQDIPFTVIVVLIASLIECFLILPNHMAHALAHSAQTHWYDMPSRIVNAGFDWVRRNLFRPLMAGVIWARYAVFAGVCVALASQIAPVITGDVQWRFFNAPERSSVTGNFSMVEGATRDDTLAMMQEMQRATEELAAKFEAEHGRHGAQAPAGREYFLPLLALWSGGRCVGCAVLWRQRRDAEGGERSASVRACPLPRSLCGRGQPGL